MYKNPKIKRRTPLYILFVIVIFAFAVFWCTARSFVNKNSWVESTISLLSLIVAALSVFLIVKELQDASMIQEAEFILNLNQTFVGNESYAKMYSKLEESNTNGTRVDLTNIEISNYLTFFETIFILLKKGVIKIETLDDLFAYRFFIAVHNETVQEKKLVRVPNNFRNIYKLEALWIEYREKKKIAVYRIDNCLKEACKKAGKENEYNEIVNDKTNNY